ncbi:MAG: hypothetical protein B6U85_02020 [Desulfurococcales archaeon ex4484_42]|nr:MAG: hypothetical protein B6U85_02020 [Desulfurococcales archaeon ex4484_42]
MDTEKDVTISLDLGGLKTDFILNHDIGNLWLRIEGLTHELASHLSRPEIATYTLLRLSNGISVYLTRKSSTTMMELPFKH